MYRSCWTAIIVAFLQCGCSVVSESAKLRQEFEMSLPQSWIEGGTTNPENTGSADLSVWWEDFNDAVLQRLIQQALAANLDLQIALSRIKEVRAQYGVVRGGYLPHLETNGSFTRGNQSSNRGSSSSSNPGTNNTVGLRVITNRYDLTFDPSWELDLFGAPYALYGARAQIASTDEALNQVRVALLADVAKNYLTYVGAKEQYDVLKRNTDVQRELSDITGARFNAGLVSELDVTQADGQLAQSEALLPSIQGEMKSAQYRLAVLLGLTPDKLIEQLIGADKLPQATAEKLQLGIPSDALRKRPDIRKAERDLQVAIAKVGVAVADLFPKFTLTGSFGYQDINSGSLFGRDGRVWHFGPSIRWPIFQGGAILDNIEVQSEQQNQAVLSYQKTVLGALTEAEISLSSYSLEQSRLKSLQEAVQANRKSLELARSLYTHGLADFARVLTAEVALSNAENSLAQSRTQLLINLVNIYQALGGGWEVDPILSDSAKSTT